MYTLLILPLSFSYFEKQLSVKQRTRHYLTFPLSIISLFAIWATTLPREKVVLDLPINEEYVLHISKTDLINSMKAQHGYSDTLKKNIVDSLFYLYFDYTDDSHLDVTALSSITQIDSTKTQLRLVKILHVYITGNLFSGVTKDDIEHAQSISAKEFNIHFETNFVEPLENRKVNHLYYDNKEMFDLNSKNTVQRTKQSKPTS